MHPGSLFDFLGGDLVDITKYATDRHKETGRPPKLAVNASSWWYVNMTTATVQEIRSRPGSGQHVNPIERSILFYTLSILQLGIQLHFVFDGPKCLRSGRKSYPGHDPPSLLFRDMLTQIGVPWHEAPAEAEAECAKMEIENVVDAVWSEDGDALAFGCQTLIRFHWEIVSSTERAEDVRKSKTQFKIYKFNDIITRYPSMNREEFILFAVLNRRPRPRDFRELHDLEPQNVLDAANLGLGRSLCGAAGSVESLRKWVTIDLVVLMMNTGKFLYIAPGFPTPEHVQDYLVPVTSNKERFLNMQQPKDPFVNERNLFSFLAYKFQLTKTQWVKYVIPVRIVRSLVATKEGEEIQHRHLKIDWKEKRQSPGARTPQIAKAKFLVCKATSLDLSDIYPKKEILQKKEKIETLTWIIRKALVNDQRSITSFLTPNSNKKGKAVASSSPGNSSQRSEHNAPLTPLSSSTFNSNGEGPSTRIYRRRRENTPPSPTHVPRRRKLPWSKGVRVTKNIRRVPKNNGKAVEANAPATVVEKEDGSSSTLNRKRARSPSESSSSSDFFEEMGGKRPKLAVERPPSTPERQATKSPATNQNPIVIASDSDEEHPRTPSPRVQGEADVIPIPSDSDDEYGSFPSLTDFPLLELEMSMGVFPRRRI